MRLLNLQGNELDDAFQLDSAMELQVLTMAFSDDAKLASVEFRILGLRALGPGEGSFLQKNRTMIDKGT